MLHSGSIPDRKITGSINEPDQLKKCCKMFSCNRMVILLLMGYGKTGFHLYIVLSKPAQPNLVKWVGDFLSNCQMFLTCCV